MPLTEDEANQIRLTIQQIEEYKKNSHELELLPQRMRAVDKLYSAPGESPDYESLSDQELHDIFDVGSKSWDVNNLGDDDKHSVTSLMMHQAKSTDYSRRDLIGIVKKWTEHKKNTVAPLDYPLEMAAFQINYLQNLDRGFSASLDQFRHDYGLIEAELNRRGERMEDQPELGGMNLGQELKDIKIRVKGISNEAKDLVNEAGVKGIKRGFEVLVKTGGSPEEVAKGIKEMRKFAKNSDSVVDISDIDLSGLDLSQSDLTGFQCDVLALSKANGLMTVKGISEEDRIDAILAGDIAKNIAKLEAQLDRLKEKPNLLDRIKAIRHGGLEGALDHLRDKIDALKEQLIVQHDVELAKTLQAQNQATLEGHRETAAQALEYLNAKREFEGALVMQALNESQMPSLSEEGLQKVIDQEQQARETMERTKQKYDEFMTNEPAMEKLRKGVSVRERLGINTDPIEKPEGPSIGQSKGVS